MHAEDIGQRTICQQQQQEEMFHFVLVGLVNARMTYRPFLSEGENTESYGENYSTVKSAPRVSATSSLRPSGRVQIDS